MNYPTACMVKKRGYFLSDCWWKTLKFFILISVKSYFLVYLLCEQSDIFHLQLFLFIIYILFGTYHSRLVVLPPDFLH